MFRAERLFRRDSHWATLALLAFGDLEQQPARIGLPIGSTGNPGSVTDKMQGVSGGGGQN
jgi:hypothetical protein